MFWDKNSFIFPYTFLLKRFKFKSTYYQIYGPKRYVSGVFSVHNFFLSLFSHETCFLKKKHVSEYQYFLIFQIKSTFDSNCLFNSVLSCINTGEPNYTPTDLRLQLLKAMAEHPESYYVSYFL